MPTPDRKRQDKPANKPTQDQSEFDSMFSGFDYQDPSVNPVAPISEPSKEEPKAKPEPMQKLRKASKATTRSKTQNIDVGQAGMDHISDLIQNTGIEGYIDDTDNTDIIPYEQINTANMPKVMSQSLSTTGVNPEFHQVSALPGNMIRAINVLGKQLFSSLTSTKTNDIYVVANLGGQGPNDDKEVNAVANFVISNGEEVSGSGDVNFDKIMPGYGAKIAEYSLDGVRYLLVKDDMGKYVYAWPDKDSAKKWNEPKQIGNNPIALESFKSLFVNTKLIESILYL
jgi:hypothetical protein